MKRCLLVVLSLVLFIGFSYSQSANYNNIFTSYTNVLFAKYTYFDDRNADDIRSSFVADVNNPYITCSQLKRIGELKIKDLLMTVRDVAGMSIPNYTNPYEISTEEFNTKDIFYVSCWVLSVIGEDWDIKWLSTILWETVKYKDVRGQVVIINSLGNFAPSPIALKNLEDLCSRVSDERIAWTLITALGKFKSVSSSEPLMVLAEKNVFSSNLKTYAYEVIATLGK